MRVTLNATLSLFLLCVCVMFVVYEIVKGTLKFMSAPVANKIYATEADIPVITICQQKAFRMGQKNGLNYDDFVDGKFFPENSTKGASSSKTFDDALDEYYYLLDVRGKGFLI